MITATGWIVKEEHRLFSNVNIEEEQPNSLGREERLSDIQVQQAYLQGKDVAMHLDEVDRCLG